MRRSFCALPTGGTMHVLFNFKNIVQAECSAVPSFVYFRFQHQQQQQNSDYCNHLAQAHHQHRLNLRPMSGGAIMHPSQFQHPLASTPTQIPAYLKHGGQDRGYNMTCEGQGQLQSQGQGHGFLQQGPLIKQEPRDCGYEPKGEFIILSPLLWPCNFDLQTKPFRLTLTF